MLQPMCAERSGGLNASADVCRAFRGGIALRQIASKRFLEAVLNLFRRLSGGCGWHSFRLQGGLFRLCVVFYTLPVPLTTLPVPSTGHIVPPTTLPVPSTTFPVPSTGQFVATPRSTARIRPNAASIRRRSEPIRTYTERSRPRPPTYLTRLGAYPTAHRTDPNLHGT